LNPDLITLDVEMQVMSGVETLAEIRKIFPRLPVIMFSTLTERGGSITLDALALGASDYVTKPLNTGSLEQTRSRIQTDLVPKIKALCQRKATGTLAPAVLKPELGKLAVAKLSSSSTRIDIVAIGTSTGGPNALAAVLPRLPSDFPDPIVVVVSASCSP
jgi:two-component system chemotaxis response regulator CheB